ncbi:hypothetical protein HZC27_05550 [Candidatus Roizmanbacteria bacterium]|nr:hypothetical protein [Candidatus Roizmanbacteria bacterium]
MKKRLNLFNRKKRFDFFSAYANKVKQYGSVIGVILFLVFIFTIIQTIAVRGQVQSLTKSKQKYLALLINDKDIEANTRYFKGKQTQLLKYEKDDANFLPYYSVLVSALSSSSQSATLDSIEIDKNRDATFIVKFKDYDGMVQFLKYVESEEFLNNFEALSMASLNLSRASGSTTKVQSAVNKNYQLQFKGRFKEINDQPR